MFTASFAPPDAGHARRPVAPATAVPPRTSLLVRALRVGRLVALLGQLWFVARFRMQSLSAAQRGRAVRSGARAVLRTLRIDVRARGHVPAASAPLLIVANHVSWLDSYAVHSVSAARFVAKSEVQAWPIIGAIAAGFGTIFLKRGCYRAAARTVGTVATALCAGQPAAVFPEGTTSDAGGLLPFYPAMFQAAVLSGARVQPVAIRYRDAQGAPTTAAAFVGETTLLASLCRLVREPRLTVELIFCAPLDPAGRTRRELAGLARAALATALDLDGAVPRLPTIRRAA